MSSRRPRRLFFVLLSLPVLFLLLLLLYVGARQSVQPPKLPDEIFGLLHFVTSPDEAGRVLSTAGADTTTTTTQAGLAHGAQLGGAVAPDKPVAMAWYAFGSMAKAGRLRTQRAGWDARMKPLREEYPLVVFSKSYCPYSKRAKRLLETYDLSPPPKVVEVDLRADAPHVKTLLTRLTHQSTFPNVVLHGRSLGGSDDLMRLHEEGQLRQVLEKAGMQVRWSGKEGEGVLL